VDILSIRELIGIDFFKFLMSAVADIPLIKVM